MPRCSRIRTPTTSSACRSTWPPARPISRCTTARKTWRCSINTACATFGCSVRAGTNGPTGGGICTRLRRLCSPIAVPSDAIRRRRSVLPESGKTERRRRIASLGTAIGEHNLRSLVQIPPPVGPFVPARTEHPKVAQAVLIEQRQVFLAVVQRDIGLAGGHVERHAEEVVGVRILEHRGIQLVELL